MKIKKLIIFAFLSLGLFISQAQNYQINYDTICGTNIETKPNHFAHYFSGNDELINTLNEYSLIPIKSKLTDFPIRVKLLICPDSTFTIAEIKNERTENVTLVTETKRLFKLLNGFIPAIKDGKPVASYLWIQINYQPKKKVKSPEVMINID